MTVTALRVVLDKHGEQHNLVTIACDGPGCPSEAQADAAQSWSLLMLPASHLGDDREGNYHFCSWPCLQRWAR